MYYIYVKRAHRMQNFDEFETIESCRVLYEYDNSKSKQINVVFIFLLTAIVHFKCL